MSGFFAFVRFAQSVQDVEPKEGAFLVKLHAVVDATDTQLLGAIASQEDSNTILQFIRTYGTPAQKQMFAGPQLERQKRARRNVTRNQLFSVVLDYFPFGLNILTADNVAAVIRFYKGGMGCVGYPNTPALDAALANPASLLKATPSETLKAVLATVATDVRAAGAPAVQGETFPRTINILGQSVNVTLANPKFLLLLESLNAGLCFQLTAPVTVQGLELPAGFPIFVRGGTIVPFDGDMGGLYNDPTKTIIGTPTLENLTLQSGAFELPRRAAPPPPIDLAVLRAYEAGTTQIANQRRELEGNLGRMQEHMNEMNAIPRMSADQRVIMEGATQALTRLQDNFNQLRELQAQYERLRGVPNLTRAQIDDLLAQASTAANNATAAITEIQGAYRSLGPLARPAGTGLGGPGAGAAAAAQQPPPPGAAAAQQPPPPGAAAAQQPPPGAAAAQQPPPPPPGAAAAQQPPPGAAAAQQPPPPGAAAAQQPPPPGAAAAQQPPPGAAAAQQPPAGTAAAAQRPYVNLARKQRELQESTNDLFTQYNNASARLLRHRTILASPEAQALAGQAVFDDAVRLYNEVTPFMTELNQFNLTADTNAVIRRYREMGDRINPRDLEDWTTLLRQLRAKLAPILVRIPAINSAMQPLYKQLNTPPPQIVRAPALTDEQRRRFLEPISAAQPPPPPPPPAAQQPPTFPRRRRSSSIAQPPPALYQPPRPLTDEEIDAMGLRGIFTVNLPPAAQPPPQPEEEPESLDMPAVISAYGQPAPLPVPAAPLPVPAAPLPVPAAPLPVPAAPLPVPAAPLPVPAAPLPVPAAPLPVPAAPEPEPVRITDERPTGPRNIGVYYRDLLWSRIQAYVDRQYPQKTSDAGNVRSETINKKLLDIIKKRGYSDLTQEDSTLLNLLEPSQAEGKKNTYRVDVAALPKPYSTITVVYDVEPTKKSLVSLNTETVSGGAKQKTSFTFVLQDARVLFTRRPTPSAAAPSEPLQIEEIAGGRRRNRTQRRIKRRISGKSRKAKYT